MEHFHSDGNMHRRPWPPKSSRAPDGSWSSLWPPTEANREIGEAQDANQSPRCPERAHISDAEDLSADRYAEEPNGADAAQQALKMEAQGQMACEIVHDFGNLLQVLTASLHIMAKRVDEGRVDDMARLIDRALMSTDRAAALIRCILTFSRPGLAGSQAVFVNAVVATVADLLRCCVGAPIGIKLNLANDLQPVQCDPDQLASALLNLALNARHAMDQGGLITIETGRAERIAHSSGLGRGAYVVVCVTDTGRGMSDDVIARAFEPFFSTQPPGQGTGLGLSMVREFVERYNGYTDVRSVLCGGTSVSLYLPCAG